MQQFKGFTPFKEMINSGQLLPGAIILVAKGHELSAYSVLPVQEERVGTGYRVRGDSSQPSSARNLLKGAVWYT